ncbi:MAG: inorganic phosphate transporter [Actinomycetales bacterium]
MQSALLALVLVATAAFAFLNGLRDASAAVALPVRTRSLTPSVAVVLAAVFNFIGVMLSLGLSVAIADRVFAVPAGTAGLGLLAAGTAAACGWGVYQWWRGYPSSSTHALIGGIAGAALGSALKGHAPPDGAAPSLLPLLVLPLLISPVAALLLAYGAVFPAMWAARYSQPSRVHRRIRYAQSVAAAAVALGHGLQDGPRTTVVVVLALGAAGLNNDGGVPPWVLLFSAVLLTSGTLAGGWRISHTLGTRLVRLDPMRGIVAQLTSGVLLFIGAIGLQLPFSTTHTMTSAIVGAGFNQRSSRINPRLWITILGAWIATPVASAVLGLLLYLAISPLL